MKQIAILPQGYRAFMVIRDNVEKGRLEYPKWYSTKAVISIGKDTQYTMEPKGFWQTTQELKKEGVLVMQMQADWKGAVTMIKPADIGYPYVLKPRGMFKTGYTLLDYKGNIILEINTNFDWKKFNSGYTITCDDTFGNNESELLLILISVHYYKAVLESAASGY